MLYVGEEDKEQADRLAKRLDTSIPRGMSLIMWPLPLFEALTEKVEKLQARVEELERQKDVNR